VFAAQVLQERHLKRGLSPLQGAVRSTKEKTKRRGRPLVTCEPGSPSAKPGSIPRVRALVVLVVVTAVWGVTFVHVLGRLVRRPPPRSLS
jgi:hypothetical protein